MKRHFAELIGWVALILVVPASYYGVAHAVDNSLHMALGEVAFKVAVLVLCGVAIAAGLTVWTTRKKETQ